MRIVVVEDEALIREGVSNILSKMDASYELVGKAENGKKGLQVIREKRPDLVIMDIQMPDMDGLTMLAKVRMEGISCKAIVLSAYSDFGYAKKAIELGIENYLLKPLKLPELKQALKSVEESISVEQSKDQLFNLEYIFLNAFTGHLENDTNLASAIEERYGIGEKEEIIIFGVKAEQDQEGNKAKVRQMMEDINAHTKEFSVYCMDLPDSRNLAAVLYQITDIQTVFERFQKRILPAMRAQICEKMIFTWGRCEGLLSIRETVLEMDNALEWNLVFDKGTLITKEQIADKEIYPMKYPVHIETQVKEAMAAGSQKDFETGLLHFEEYFRQRPCEPQETKEAVTRLFLALGHVAKESGKMQASVSTQEVLKKIAEALWWEDIGGIFREFYALLAVWPEEKNISLLVQKAQQNIQEYYNQGITLEEIAAKLHVSEEYLSTMFKKETGKTFSETIRGYRIERVKELLLKSSLKLNQIADMTGYADPKYMSKVFKEEVGMLPSEYRKKNS